MTTQTLHRFFFAPDPFVEWRWPIAWADTDGTLRALPLPDVAEMDRAFPGYSAGAAWLLSEVMSALKGWDPRAGDVPQGFEECVMRETVEWPVLSAEAFDALMEARAVAD